MVEISKGKVVVEISKGKVAKVFCDIEIHDKVRHVGTICRVAIVNLTDQIG